PGRLPVDRGGTYARMYLPPCDAPGPAPRGSMPPRPVGLLIVAGWLAASGWLFYRQVWPYLRGGEPPAFLTGLTDEHVNASPPVLWDVFRKGAAEQELLAHTSVKCDNGSETFTLSCHFGRTGIEAPKGPVALLDSVYRVGARDSRVLGLSAEVHLRLS